MFMVSERRVHIDLEIVIYAVVLHVLERLHESAMYSCVDQ
jgi:hypothetical protein